LGVRGRRARAASHSLKRKKLPYRLHVLKTRQPQVHSPRICLSSLSQLYVLRVVGSSSQQTSEWSLLPIPLPPSAQELSGSQGNNTFQQFKLRRGRPKDPCQCQSLPTATNQPSTTFRNDNYSQSMPFVGLRDTVDVVCVENPIGAVTEPMNKSPFACGSAMAQTVRRAMEVISTTTGAFLFPSVHDFIDTQLHFLSRSHRSKFAMRFTTN
jgi:hypothetical protein